MAQTPPMTPKLPLPKPYHPKRTRSSPPTGRLEHPDQPELPFPSLPRLRKFPVDDDQHEPLG
jgi:hypothetical protein